jgi:hypothetical protein
MSITRASFGCSVRLAKFLAGGVAPKRAAGGSNVG